MPKGVKKLTDIEARVLKALRTGPKGRTEMQALGIALENSTPFYNMKSEGLIDYKRKPGVLKAYDYFITDLGREYLDRYETGEDVEYEHWGREGRRG